MSVLVFVENDEGNIKKSSLEAISYASHLDSNVVAIALGSNFDAAKLANAGKAGAAKVLHVADDKYNQGIVQAYASAIAEAMNREGANIFVLANSSLGDALSARVAVKIDAAIASRVIALPDTSNGFKVKRSIYTGKAFATIEMNGDKKVIALKKNAVELKKDGGSASVEAFSPSINDADFSTIITSTDKATGDVLLPEAEIVISGGRGLKGPENWGMIEELAKELGAATGCSKPVSDMDWRPHHEHVGQTGIKVSPNLYIAIGISGAIQHLAGVNSSKYIVVINKDADAPFFKAADYGIVGDAFDVVPKLIAAIKASK